MKSMVLHEYGAPLRLEEREIPVPGYGEVLLKVDRCGICGTDLKIISGKLSSIVSLPHVPGHEIAGTVVETGEGVSKARIGERGIAYFYLPCHDCELCRTGHENICRTISRLGFEHDGGYAEYVVLPEYGFCPIPVAGKVAGKLAGTNESGTPAGSATVAGTSESGAPADPGAGSGSGDPAEYAVLTDAVLTPYHALVSLGNLQAGMSVLIYGLGGLGLHAVQIAKLFGARVWAVDTRQGSLELAKSFGADRVIDGTSEDVGALLLAETDGRGVDLVFEGVGIGATFTRALPCLRKGGTLLLTGYDPVNLLPLDSLGMHYNEWKIMGTRLGTKEELLHLIDFVKEGKLKPVVSKTYPFTEANTALEDLKSGDVVGRIVLTM